MTEAWMRSGRREPFRTRSQSDLAACFPRNQVRPGGKQSPFAARHGDRSGGIAKGWIVKKAAQVLHQYVEVCGVSAGGDILFIGHPQNGTDWDVYLEDPLSPTEMLTQLHIPSGAVATSSIMKRTWSQGEKVRHHLIDPRTGESAKTDWLSVTVISPSVIDAEVYAKAILISGEKELSHLLGTKRELTFIAVDPEGKLSGSANYKEYIYEFASNAF